jgi:hypothetical protein
MLFHCQQKTQENIYLGAGQDLQVMLGTHVFPRVRQASALPSVISGTSSAM